MTPIEENATLVTDLDCRNFNLLNILHFYPAPANLVQVTDPGLGDDRVPLPGSVTNDSVAETAGIVQSKFNMNGAVPPAWLGSSETQAASGSLSERLSRKGAVNGYAAVDVNLKLLPANVTGGPGTGTVGYVALQMPPEFTVSSPIISGSGTLNPSWVPVPDGSWFGVNGVTLDPVLKPRFQTGQFPPGLVPPLSATKFTTGIFDPELLPVAVGLGDGHSTGVVPDPGENGDPADYLGRDMEWQPFDFHLAYQPYVPDPVISLASITGDIANVTIRSGLEGSSLFYRNGTIFIEAHPSGPDIFITLQVALGAYIEAYASKPGYNNSGIASYTVPEE